MNITMKYGSDTISFQVPENQVIGELKIKEMPLLADPEEAIRNALHNPIDSPPLKDIVKPNQTVTLIVNDPTRVANSSIFLPILLEELNEAGVPDCNISILFALGTHRLMTPEEMEKEVGSDVASRVSLYNSDCHDENQFVYFGNTSRGTPVWFHKKAVEADHIICTGSIVHHFFAGFGGGRKAMLPGVSRYDTIRANHSLMFDPQAVIGRLDGNPVYEDQIEGVEMHRPSFFINTILNEKKDFLAIFAGDYRTAHLKACAFVDQVYGAEIDQSADLVIATCGGYPKDMNVYQLQKTMDNAWCAVREGGVVILLSECREGTGSTLYEEMMRKYQTPDAVEDAVRADFQIGAHKAYAVTRLMKKATFILVSTLSPDLAKSLLFTPAATIDAALDIAYQKVGNHATILLMPQGSLTVPITKN